MERNINLIDDIGKELRRIRTAKGFTLQEIAEKSGVSSMYISEIERDKKSPSDELLEKLSSLYDVELVDMFEGFQRLPEKVVDEILNNRDLFELLFRLTYECDMSLPEKSEFYKKLNNMYNDI